MQVSALQMHYWDWIRMTYRTRFQKKSIATPDMGLASPGLMHMIVSVFPAYSSVLLATVMGSLSRFMVVPGKFVVLDKPVQLVPSSKLQFSFQSSRDANVCWAISKKKLEFCVLRRMDLSAVWVCSWVCRAEQACAVGSAEQAAVFVPGIRMCVEQKKIEFCVSAVCVATDGFVCSLGLQLSLSCGTSLCSWFCRASCSFRSRDLNVCWSISKKNRVLCVCCVCCDGWICPQFGSSVEFVVRNKPVQLVLPSKLQFSFQGSECVEFQRGQKKAWVSWVLCVLRRMDLSAVWVFSWVCRAEQACAVGSAEQAAVFVPGMQMCVYQCVCQTWPFMMEMVRKMFGFWPPTNQTISAVNFGLATEEKYAHQT